jgi:hypothetical protein
LITCSWSVGSTPNSDKRADSNGSTVLVLGVRVVLGLPSWVWLSLLNVLLVSVVLVQWRRRWDDTEFEFETHDGKHKLPPLALTTDSDVNEVGDRERRMHDDERRIIMVSLGALDGLSSPKGAASTPSMSCHMRCRTEAATPHTRLLHRTPSQQPLQQERSVD